MTDRIKTKSSQTETEFTSKTTQTKLSEEQKSDEEVRLSRVDPTKTIKEEKNDNEVPPAMKTSTSLEASHEFITEGLVATIENDTNTTESEEDTTEKAPTGVGSAIHCRGNEKITKPPPNH